MMTLDEFNKIPNHTIFAKGVVPNSPKGIYMTDHRLGDNLIWIAKKNHGDWAIYTHWEEKGQDYVEDYGDKLRTKDDILKLLPSTDEVFSLYRR